MTRVISATSGQSAAKWDSALDRLQGKLREQRLLKIVLAAAPGLPSRRRTTSPVFGREHVDSPSIDTKTYNTQRRACLLLLLLLVL